MPEFFTVQAFRGETRDERAEHLAMKYGFVPTDERERAEVCAKRCNQLNLNGIEFKVVAAECTSADIKQESSSGTSSHEEPDDPQEEALVDDEDEEEPS
jgi:hypothetical protein